MIRRGGQNQPLRYYFRFQHSGAMPQSPNSLIFSRLHPSLRNLLHNPGLKKCNVSGHKKTQQGQYKISAGNIKKQMDNSQYQVLFLL